MTFLLETIRLGLTNLRLHLLRSVLTALGIILGVAAVIIMSSLGEGSKREALAQIEALGARNIIVRSQKPPESPSQSSGQQNRGMVARFGLTRDDFDVIAQNFQDAAAIVPLKEIGGQILRDEFRKTSQAFGTTPELQRVANLRVSRGRYLSTADMDERARVAVIGSRVAADFFKLEDPIGKTIRIDAQPFTVIGVLAPVGLSGGAGNALVGRDLNLDVHVPMTTARENFGDTVFRRTGGSFEANSVQVSEIYLMVPTRERVLVDADRLRRIIEHRRPGMPDVAIIVPFELLESAERTAMTYTLVFGAVAGIALLVGGIGIMNIMLASVTERTREIGIRRAIGATRRHILWQFLVETSVLSVIGGLLGVAAGALVSIGIPRLADTLKTSAMFRGAIGSDVSLVTAITPGSVVLSFSVAVATGLIFGMYPARKAAAQDPIVALRHD